MKIKIGKVLSMLYIGMWFGICLTRHGKEMVGETYVFNSWYFFTTMLTMLCFILAGYLWGKDE